MKQRDILETLSKKKYAVRGIAVFMSAVLAASSITVYCVNAENAEEIQEEETQAEEEKKEETITNVLNEQIVQDDGKEQVDKEETVYVISDASGNAKEVIVSDWLKNPDKKDILNDISDLDDIENVKGNESFTKDGNQITWQADGSDIYYQGKTSKETPVNVKITYYLEDKEISPKELVGKSGNVRIRFDYENKEKQAVTIDDKEEEMYVPFTVMTGMMFPTEKFTNVTVKNGKVLSEGNHDIVVGIAFPGLEESLNISSEDFEEDVEIPDYVEVSAQVTDFSMDMTITAVLSDALNDVNLNKEDSLDELNDSMDELSDASEELVTGSGKLKDGADTLQSKTGDLKDGAASLSKGVSEYTGGVAQLSSGIDELKAGTGKLNENVPSLIKGTGDLKKGADDAKKGADSLVKGYKQVTKGADSLADGALQVSNGVSQLKQGIDDMFAAIDTAIAQNQANAQNAAQAATQASQELQAHLTDFATKVSELMYIQQQLNSVSANDPGYAAYAQAYQAKAAEVQQGLGSLQTTVASDVQRISDYSAQAGGATGAAQALQTVKDTAEEKKLTENIAKLQTGASQVSQGAAALNQGINGYTNEKGEKVTGLAEGTKALQEGLEKLQKGMATLEEKSGTLKTGIKQLDSGAGKLSEGAGKLKDNSSKLTEGAGALLQGTIQFSEGVEQLKSGTRDLNDGMIQFDEEGIQKLEETFSGDMNSLLTRLDKIKEIGQNYNTFTALSDNASGKVKFIIKTEGVE